MARTDKPWVYGLANDGTELLYDLVFIENYLDCRDGMLGIRQEDGTYLLGDGDCWNPDRMDWLGDGTHFFNGGLIEPLLAKHFKKVRKSLTPPQSPPGPVEQTP